MGALPNKIQSLLPRVASAPVFQSDATRRGAFSLWGRIRHAFAKGAGRRRCAGRRHLRLGGRGGGFGRRSERNRRRIGAAGGGDGGSTHGLFGRPTLPGICIQRPKRRSIRWTASGSQSVSSRAGEPADALSRGAPTAGEHGSWCNCRSSQPKHTHAGAKRWA